jgi:Recombination endonuclease VII
VGSEWHQAGCNIKVQYQGAISRCNIKDRSRVNQREIKEDSKEVLARGAPSARGGRGKEARKGRKEERKKVRAASRLRPRAGASGHFLGHPREAERAARLAAISRITLSQRRNRIGQECRAHRPNLDGGAFRGWVCNPCNTGAGIMDDVARLEKRVAFLKSREKKMERVALIKAVHEARR